MWIKVYEYRKGKNVLKKALLETKKVAFEKILKCTLTQHTDREKANVRTDDSVGTSTVGNKSDAFCDYLNFNTLVLIRVRRS